MRDYARIRTDVERCIIVLTATAETMQRHVEEKKLGLDDEVDPLAEDENMKKMFDDAINFDFAKAEEIIRSLL